MNTPRSAAELAVEEIYKQIRSSVLPTEAEATAIIVKHFPQQPFPVNPPPSRFGTNVPTKSETPLPASGECEFCELDGMGHHAPRCPVQLESEIANLADLLDKEMTIAATEREAREKAEIQLAQKDQIYLERLDAFEQVTKRAEAAESKSGDVAKALRAYPDSDLVSLATTLEAIRRKAEVVFPLAQKLVEAVQRTHIGPEASDDCDVCRATKELAAALDSVPAESRAFLKPTHERCDWKPVESANPPQVDATLESRLREAWEMGFRLAVSYGDNYPHFAGDQREKQWDKASAILAHARKSQPVNERHAAHALAMLALQSERYGNDPDYRDATDNVLAWTMDSAAPGESLEAALANALRALLLDTQHEEHSCGAADMNCPVDKARAVLAKFERKTEGAK